MGASRPASRIAGRGRDHTARGGAIDLHRAARATRPEAGIPTRDGGISRDRFRGAANTRLTGDAARIQRQNEVPDAFLGDDVGDRTEEREAALLAVDGVLARREGHAAAGTVAALPDPESKELEALERTAGDVNSVSASLPAELALSFGLILTVNMLSGATLLLMHDYRGSFASRGASNT